MKQLLPNGTIVGGGGDMYKADNLSGLTNYTAARSSLGLGTAATQNTGAFDAAGAAAAAQAASQPLDSDLTAIAALSTTAFGRALLELANAATLRTAAGVIVNASGESLLATPFSITAAADVYQDTGLSVTLPAAGTYIVEADVRYLLNCSVAGAFLTAEFYNSSDGAAVANSETMLNQAGNTGVFYQGTTHIRKEITVTASKVIKLYALRSGSGFTNTDIYTNANGRTRMSYLQVY
jgi:hypothetical protein